MDLWRQIDIYCERTDPGLWSEPANALTNLAFLVAAVLVWRRGAGAPPPSGQDARILGALIAAIGVGSGLFHTLATVWAAWLDSGLIALYIYVWLARFLARVAGLRWTGVIAGLVAFAILSRGLTALFSPGSLNGSYSYFPALIALAACGGYAWRKDTRERRGSVSRPGSSSCRWYSGASTRRCATPGRSGRTSSGTA